MPSAAEVEQLLPLPLPQALEAWREKTRRLVPTRTWRDLWQDQHDTAWAVAGAMEQALLEDLRAAVDEAIERGESYQRFRRDFRRIAADHGWAYRGEEAWRALVIYRTNILSSYAIGRHAQLLAAGFKYWVYHHSDDVLHPRPLHVAWDGLALPPDHEFWRVHFPPNGWGCQCTVSGAYTEAAARALGGDPSRVPDPAWLRPGEDGTYAGVDLGWAYRPGDRTAQVREAWRQAIAEEPDPMWRARFAAMWEAPPPPAPPPPRAGAAEDRGEGEPGAGEEGET